MQQLLKTFIFRNHVNQDFCTNYIEHDNFKNVCTEQRLYMYEQVCIHLLSIFTIIIKLVLSNYFS